MGVFRCSYLSQAGAEGGTLTVMVGGDKADYMKALPVIDSYSKVKLMGPAGNGQLTKMVNQICIAGLVQGLSKYKLWNESRT